MFQYYTVGAWRNRERRLSSGSEVTHCRDCQTGFFNKFWVKEQSQENAPAHKVKRMPRQENKNHVMEPLTDTAQVAKNPRWARLGTRRKANTTFLLKGYNNKVTSSSIQLCTQRSGSHSAIIRKLLLNQMWSNMETHNWTIYRERKRSWNTQS